MVLLVDFTVFSPSADLRVDWEWHRQHSKKTWEKHGASQEKIEFCDRILRGSGIADNRAALPAWLQPDKSDEPKTDTAHSGREARMVQGQCVAELLRKTGIEPAQIDILVTNCSIYCPVPSMASMLVNMFGLREDVQAYHLGGMGCSMGVVGLNLVRDLLAARPNSIALFVTNEVVTAGFYLGDRKEALVTNALFRMGGAAAILTNRPSWRLRAKYSLVHVNRVHTGRFPRAYSCLNLEPDEQGHNGIMLTKDLPSEAALCLNKAIARAAPHVMTWRQYGEAAAHFARDFAARASGGERPAAYQPDFTQCADHFLIHAGGYAILQAVKKGLRLPADKMMPAFVTLRDYGNTSSSSTWYTLAFIESCEGIRPNQKVMQIGVGGGMKAGVAIWRALRSFADPHPAWAHLGGRRQLEADLPRPITVDYASRYNANAAREAQEKLRLPRPDSERVSFEPAREPRWLNVRSWRDVSRDDPSDWWRRPPGQPVAGDGAEGRVAAQAVAGSGEDAEARPAPEAAGPGPKAPVADAEAPVADSAAPTPVAAGKAPVAAAVTEAFAALKEGAAAAKPAGDGAAARTVQVLAVVDDA